MPADHEPDQLDRWLDEQVQPLPPPPGTFELITRRARRRKIRKAVISVASAAAVAAAVAVAVPVGLSLNLTSPPTNGSLAGGQSAIPTTPGTAPAVNGTAAGTGKAGPTTHGGPAASSTATPAAGATASGGLSQPGALPPNFTPSSVTWDSLSTGWVIGQAGTAGQCANANPDICTSIAHTSDGGQTWKGLPAPSTAGVTGLRFLNATYGWAYGPELWATADGGQHWHQVSTGSAAVTDLETVGNRAYALFGTCTPPNGSTGGAIANCTSYTLMTTVAGSGTWTAVSGVPAGLATASGGKTSAEIVLAGATGSAAATGYLVAPDGSLYSGPLDGGAWSKAATLPSSCIPGAARPSGLPSGVLLATTGATTSGADKLALVCDFTDTNGANLDTYGSSDSGVTWGNRGGSVQAGGVSPYGTPESLTATSAGTLVLATETSSDNVGGLYVLGSGTTQSWTSASLVNSPDNSVGFSYVGMTSATQGVALGASAGLHGIWLTRDGGQTWTYQAIQS